MKGKYCIFLLFILVALISCNDPKSVTDTLHRAEALMNEYSDSAWTLLNTISPDEIEQNRNRALYALLYIQAQDKTYRDETNDSLISVAVDYYRDTDDVRRKFLSYYYKGRVHFNAKDYLNATTCYMEAEQLVDEVFYACRTLNKKVVGGGQAMFSTGMLRLSFGDKILGW